MPQLILNVDDFEPQRHARSLVLRRAGFDVIEAGTGRQTLALIAERRPALVVLDLHLPDIDGFEVCRRVKADPAAAGLLVLHVSATFVEPGARVLALENGADAYLPEPMEPMELVAQVRSLLRLKELQQHVETQRAQLEAVYQAMNDGVTVFNMAGEIVMVNDVVARRSGYSGVEEMKRLAVIELPFELEDLDGAALPFDRWPVYRVLRGEILSDYELRARRPDTGQEWVFSYSGRLIRDDQGKPVLGLVVSRDITARKRAEDALARANAELAAADRQKDEFLAILSHELRNPLAPIHYALPVLLGQGLDDAGSRAIAVVQRQVDHLTRLVDDLLDVSRIAKGKVELRRERITLASVIKAAAEAASPRIAAKNHTLDVRVPVEPIWLYGDPARLAQIVTNLLNNSAKYTTEGGELLVEATIDNHVAVIRVRDNGMGIPPESLPLVFDMFRQVHRPGEITGGLGIGLGLVKRLVEMHGGSVQAQSAGVGKGAEFVVRLPLAPS